MEIIPASPGPKVLLKSPLVCPALFCQGGPDGDREVNLSGGQFGLGLAEGAPTKLSVPYDVAKAIFIEGNPQAAMQAFMSGQIKIEGDMTKIMAMQSAGASPSPEQQAFQQSSKYVPHRRRSDSQ